MFPAAMETGLNWPVTAAAVADDAPDLRVAAMETGLNWPVTGRRHIDAYYESGLPQWRPALIGRLRQYAEGEASAYLTEPQWRPALIGRLRWRATDRQHRDHLAAMETGLNWPVTAGRRRPGGAA